jgi:hypothetical protein
MHQRPSRCWTWAMVSAATSDRRSPQPSSTAMTARSHSLWRSRALHLTKLVADAELR